MLTAATVVGLGLALAACTGSSSPYPSPTTASPVTAAPSAPRATPTSTPEPAPTPTAELVDVTVAPTPPAALDGPPTDENAAAVAEYFMSLFPYLFATGDGSEWERLSGPSCGYCSGVVNELRNDLARERHSDGGAFEILESSSEPSGSGEFITWVTFIQHPSRTVDKDGDVVEEFPETRRSRATLLLEWNGAGWRVNGVDPALIEVL